jgi:molybdopterin molybdotransferase
LRLLKVTAVADALGIIGESFTALAAEEIGLVNAGGRYLAADVRAPEDVPAFNRSIVDGYAVHAGETFGAQETMPSLLKLSGEVKMGEPAGRIKPGECCYVPTGGMLPSSADAVVMVEYTDVLGEEVSIYRQVTPGENLIKRGEDLQSGHIALAKGKRLRSGEMGLLASLGVTAIKVVKRPVVGVLSTGNELVPSETPDLPPGKVRDTNSMALMALCNRIGAQAVYGGILGDSYEQFLSGIKTLLERADMVVLSGGSSVGSRDYTHSVLKELGMGRFLWEGLAVQPGKPTLLTKVGNKPILGLPGHPVSALNIFLVFGRAILERLSGAGADLPRPYVVAKLTRNIPSHPGRTDIVRVALNPTEAGMTANPVFGRSGLLRTLSEADGVIWIPATSDGLDAGEEVQVYLWE